MAGVLAQGLRLEFKVRTYEKEFHYPHCGPVRLHSD